MKVINGINYLTIGEVAVEINRSAQTIKRWYDWVNGLPRKEKKQYDLPQIRRDFDKKGTRYIQESDVPKLIAFRDNMEYGSMAKFNMQFWGERGQDIKDRK